ncbi:DUF805 domain-containing protein [Rubrimonas sp.]|uniref:DUF805 domain-containing protein n=1 Tax=Rubrimonas sp. TaxID=2036015 RepID=UPI002FDCC142
MGFVDAVRTCFAKYVTFSGRARRPEFWWFVLFTVLAAVVAALLDMALGFGAGDSGPVSLIVSLALTLPGIAAAWRRLHDVGRPGWFALAPNVAGAATGVLVFAMAASIDPQTGAPPLVFQTLAALGGLATLGLFVLLVVWLASKSQPGENRFGPEPAA